jgi:cell wall-associated NlpC family hydrolase
MFHSISQNATFHAVVKISVADMRREPRFQSEMVNQVILGTIMPVLKEGEQFILAENWDGYQGWISRQAVLIERIEKINRWQTVDRIIITATGGCVYRQATNDSDILTDLVAGTILYRENKDTEYSTVRLPGSELGYVSNSSIEDLRKHEKIPFTSENVILQARKFLGIPYLWGGTSTKGFDCSGFVQTVFRLLNQKLPRDSHQMALVGTSVPFNNHFDNIKPSDLLFFGHPDGKIDHVAIYIGEKRYIHCRGKVRISSLDPRDPLFEGDLLLRVQRQV